MTKFSSQAATLKFARQDSVCFRITSNILHLLKVDKTGPGWCPLHVFGIVSIEPSINTKHFTSVNLILNQNMKIILHISKFISWSYSTTSHTHTHTHPHTLTHTRTWTECSRTARHILACESGALRIETSSLLAVTKTLSASGKETDRP